jgi:L-threonylcarbamoyladenylate synthase
MNTQFFSAIDADTLKRAGDCLRAGGLVAFPTETVYGLGANALDEDAVARIFVAKDRPSNDPIIVHIAARDQLRDIVREVPPIAEQLADQFWPGPLTMIFRKSPRVPANSSAGLDTVAVRMPSHPVALALIRAAGVPIGAPSANTFRRPSPTTAAHVMKDLSGRVDIVLDGGSTSIGVESTVLDVTSDPPVILRPGGVPLEALRALVPDVAIRAQFVEMTADESPTSPGMLTRHYAPSAEMILFTGEADRVRARMIEMGREMSQAGKRVGALVTASDEAIFSETGFEVFNLGDDMTQVSSNLFTGLRELEARHVDMILARDVSREGLGMAVWDRLFRAAEGRVIHVD